MITAHHLCDNSRKQTTSVQQLCVIPTFDNDKTSSSKGGNNNHGNSNDNDQ